jgi:outer membrane protein assembly factor BamB
MPSGTDGGVDAGQEDDATVSDSGGRAGPQPFGPFNVLTNRYDNARSGSNTSETLLTTANVNPAMFGLKYSAPTMGRVYGHALYASSLTMGGAKHNAVFVATEHNMVYAFDADAGTPLWSKTLEPPWLPGQDGFTPRCGDFGGLEVGITGTPVISADYARIYMAAKTMGKYVLHALDLTTGNDVQGSPVTIVPAAAPGAFDSAHHLNRPGLLLVHGVVYVAFGSHCDNMPYHGWLLGYDAQTLALKYTFNTTPNTAGGAIWMSGTGPSSDGTSIWFSVGNAGTKPPTDPEDMSWSVVRTDLTLKVLAHHMEPVAGDNDLVTGAILVGNQVLTGGKSGQVRLLNASDTSLIQRVMAGAQTHNIATWNGPAGQMIYTCDEGATVHAWQLTGGMLVDKGTNPAVKTGHPGGMITTSSNGMTPGTGIVWVLVPGGGLYALDATDVTKPVLWSSNANPADAITAGAKFSPPIVASGRVYAATFGDKLMVYGLK